MNHPDVLLSEDAERDIVEIARYTGERWGEIQQARYLDAVESFFQRLADPLRPGRLRPDIGPDVRVQLLQRHYWVYYRHAGRAIHVLRILHASRRQSEAFRSSPGE